MTSQFSLFSDHIITEYSDLNDFMEKINHHNVFQGHGYLQENTHRYHFFHLDEIYATKEIKIDEKSAYKYIGLYQLKSNFFDSSFFLDSYQHHFRNFELKIPVEIKLFNYAKETKLLISHKDKIDLLYTCTLQKDQEGIFSHLEAKNYPSIDEVLKKLKMEEQLEKNLALILARKKTKLKK